MQVKFLTELITEFQSKNNIIMQNNEFLLEKCLSLEKSMKVQKKINVNILEKDNDFQMPDNNQTNSQIRSNRTLITENMTTRKVEEKDSATNRKQWSEIVSSNLKYVKSKITSNTELSAENIDKTGEINRNTQNSSNNWVNVFRKKALKPKDKVNMTCTGLKNKADNTVFRAATSRFYLGKVAGKDVTEDTIRFTLKRSMDMKVLT
ncbi:hypothetical protein WA026_012769 [Henosepilachna vigintioctopunctata]|uniref:Uncharacterized protein n=1 Tax=Henosepilachna vigintioctopunctata TaxID=420089 RepID=A0AAW1U8S9_9CUCU